MTTPTRRRLDPTDPTDPAGPAGPAAARRSRLGAVRTVLRRPLGAAGRPLLSAAGTVLRGPLGAAGRPLPRVVRTVLRRPPQGAHQGGSEGARLRQRPAPAVLPGGRGPGGGASRAVLAAGAALVIAWTLVALLWPHLVPYDPDLQDPLHRFAPPGTGHWLGTDQFGRDTFSRMLAGARPVLQVAPLATGLAVLVGTVIGLVAGCYGGWIDEIAMRVLDAVVVFPAIIAVVLFVALVGRSVTVLVLVIAGAFVPLVARSVRAATLVERDKPYVEAARMRGEGPWSLLRHEIFPNVSQTVLVEATSRLGDAIFAAATLSFLGLGQPPGSPEWGASVADNRAWLQLAPWTVLAPALAVASLVVGIALVADSLRAHQDRP